MNLILVPGVISPSVLKVENLTLKRISQRNNKIAAFVKLWITPFSTGYFFSLILLLLGAN